MAKDEVAAAVKEWAARALQDELVWVREASTVGRRAYHEGVAAAMAYAAGDQRRAENLLTQILVDYTGVRNVEGRRGYAAGVTMTRGVVSYLDVQGKLALDEWERDGAAAVADV